MPRARSGRRPKSILGFFVVFGTMWMAIVGVFDGVILYGIAGQYESLRFVPVQATVLESRVISESDSDGTTYRPAIRYRYEFGGREYTSDRIRTTTWSTSNSGPSRRMVDDHPRGAEFTAYVDPRRPDRSIIVRGITSADFFMPLFLVPFNAVGVGIWFFVLRTLFHRTLHPRGGLSASRRHGVLRLRVGRVSPVFGFVGGLGGTSFVMLFVAAFAGAEDAPVWLTLGAMGAAVAVGVLAALVILVRNTNPSRDVLIDTHAGTVRLPKRGQRRKEIVELALGDVRAVALESFLDESNTSVNDKKVPHHSPVLLVADGEGTETKYRLVNWMDEKRAEKLTAWLATELHLPLVVDRQEEPDEDDATLDEGAEPEPGGDGDDGGGAADASWLDQPVEAPRVARSPATVEEALAAGRAARSGGGVGPVAAAFGFGVLWNSILAVFFVFVANGVMQFIDMSGWTLVHAEVLSAEVAFDDNGSTPQFTLGYQMDGVPIETTLERTMFTMVSGREDDAQAMMSRYPVGSLMPVYVDPDEPARAVAERTAGLGMIAFILAFLTPFVLVGVMCFAPMVALIVRKIAPSTDRPIAVRDLGDRIVVRNPRIRPLAAVAIAAGGAGFVGAFVAMPLMIVLRDSDVIGYAYLGGVWLFGLVIGARSALGARSARDLEIDRMTGRVRFPVFASAKTTAKKRRADRPRDGVAVDRVVRVSVQRERRAAGDDEPKSRAVAWVRNKTNAKTRAVAISPYESGDDAPVRAAVVGALLGIPVPAGDAAEA